VQPFFFYFASPFIRIHHYIVVITGLPLKQDTIILCIEKALKQMGKFAWRLQFVSSLFHES